MACLPLKITTGTLIQAYNLGADTVLMAGGSGLAGLDIIVKCIENLKDLNYNMIITLEPDGDILGFRKVKNLLEELIYKILRAIKNATQVAIEVDKLEGMVSKIRPN